MGNCLECEINGGLEEEGEESEESSSQKDAEIEEQKSTGCVRCGLKDSAY